jgi:flagellar basal-body rod modification protein FlgD
MDVSGVGTAPSSGIVENPYSTLGKSDFLEMLITKLKYQDPTNPMDDESFVADMAQFSTLESMENLNSTFADSIESLNTNLISLIMMQNTTQAASLIGKTVVLSPGEGTPDVSGTVDIVRFVDGQPNIVVAGQEYSITTVKEIQA